MWFFDFSPVRAIKNRMRLPLWLMPCGARFAQILLNCDGLRDFWRKMSAQLAKYHYLCRSFCTKHRWRQRYCWHWRLWDWQCCCWVWRFSSSRAAVFPTPTSTTIQRCANAASPVPRTRNSTTNNIKKKKSKTLFEMNFIKHYSKLALIAALVLMSATSCNEKKPAETPKPANGAALENLKIRYIDEDSIMAN